MVQKIRHLRPTSDFSHFRTSMYLYVFTLRDGEKNTFCCASSSQTCVCVRPEKRVVSGHHISQHREQPHLLPILVRRYSGIAVLATTVSGELRLHLAPTFMRVLYHDRVAY